MKQYIKRIIILLPILFIFSLYIIPKQVSARTFRVNTLYDDYDQVCDDHCSLRDAVYEANSIKNKEHKIVLPAGVIDMHRYTSDDTLELDPGTGDIDLRTRSKIIIRGQGIGVTKIDAHERSRIFEVRNGTAVFQDLTLQNGHTFESNAEVGNSFDDLTPYTTGGAVQAREANLKFNRVLLLSNTAYSGGAVSSDFGSVVIKNSVFSNNSAQYGGAIIAGNDDTDAYLDDFTKVKIYSSIFSGNQAVSSGGVFIDSSITLDVVVRDSMFINNSAGEDGGAFKYSNNDHWRGYALQFTNCTFRDNSAGEDGGAIAYQSRRFWDYNYERMLVERSRFINNHALRGGAIYHGVWHETYNKEDGTMSHIRASAFVDNIADETGGAIHSTNAARTRIHNSTFSQNKAGIGGAAIFGSHKSKIRVLHSTLVDNRSTSESQPARVIYLDSSAINLFIKNSIISESGSDKNITNHLCATDGGNLSSDGYNIISSEIACTGLKKKKTDLFTVAELHGPYSDNGKPDYYSLESTSPALNRIPLDACVGWKDKSIVRDQRMNVRPNNTKCDVGSIEQ